MKDKLENKLQELGNELVQLAEQKKQLISQIKQIDIRITQLVGATEVINGLLNESVKKPPTKSQTNKKGTVNQDSPPTSLY